jgi:hypothetical protein
LFSVYNIRIAAVLVFAAALLNTALFGAGAAWLAWHPPKAPSASPVAAAANEPPKALRGPEVMLKIVQSRQTIDAVLRQLMDETPALAAARFAILQEDSATLESIRVLHFSFLAEQRVTSHPAQPMLQNLPLWGWRDFLADIVAKPSCVVKNATDFTDPDTIDRLRVRGVAAMLACSVFSPGGNFLGVLFGDVDRLSDLPRDIAPIMARMGIGAAQIGKALVLAGDNAQ